MFITSTMSITENDRQPVQTGQTLLRGSWIPREAEELEYLATVSVNTLQTKIYSGYKRDVQVQSRAQIDY